MSDNYQKIAIPMIVTSPMLIIETSTTNLLLYLKVNSILNIKTGGGDVLKELQIDKCKKCCVEPVRIMLSGKLDTICQKCVNKHVVQDSLRYDY
jgi:hypothetical protein